MHTEQLRKQQCLLRWQLCYASRCFVLQAEHLICGEVLALTNNTSASCYVLHCVTLFDIIPLEISICSLMNTDLFAIGVISVSDASQFLKSEKVRGSIELRENGASLSFSISAVVASHEGEIFLTLWLCGMNLILLILPTISLWLLNRSKKKTTVLPKGMMNVLSQWVNMFKKNPFFKIKHIRIVNCCQVCFRVEQSGWKGRFWPVLCLLYTSS